MSEKATRLRHKARLFLSSALAVSILLRPEAFFLSSSHRAQAETLAPLEKDKVYLCVTGPNDGEPINGRVLRLGLETNYSENGRLAVFVNDTYLHTLPLLQGGFRDAQGIAKTHLDIDLILAGSLAGENLLHMDAGPVRVSVSLYSPTAAKLVTTGRWSGYVGKPWYEYVGSRPMAPQGPNGADGGPRMAPAVLPDLQAPAVPAAPSIALHTLRHDIFYMLIAAQKQELLRLTPDDPKLLLEGCIVDCGPSPTIPAAGKPQPVVWPVISLSSLSGPGWPQAYLVLWTIDTQGVWRRSVISQIVR